MKNHITDSSGANHGSINSYLAGFILSVIFTIIPFYMVMNKVVSPIMLIAVIAMTSTVQIAIQLVYFLHINQSSEQRWNVIGLIFTLLIMAIVVVGSLWIMYNLNVNMMIF